MRRKALAQCKLIRMGHESFGIIDEANTDERTRLNQVVKDVLQFQASICAPRNYNPSDKSNYIKDIELGFQKLCTSLEELGVNRPQDLTVFEFYAKIRFFKEKKKPNERN